MKNSRDPSRARGPWLCLGALLVLCAPEVRGAEAPPAAAPTTAELETAKTHYQSGAALYEAGKYQAAKEAFEESYRLSRLPDLLFNLSSVSRKLNRPGDAVHYLERYLEARPAAEDRPNVERDIAALKAQMAAEQAAADKAAADKAAADKAAADKAAALQRPAPSRLPPWPALGLAGGGVALLIIGFSTGGAALAAARQVEAGTSFDRALHERGQALNGTAIAFDVIGSLALAGGAAWTAVWWFKGRHAATPATKTTLRLAPQGAGLAVLGTF